MTTIEQLFAQIDIARQIGKEAIGVTLKRSIKSRAKLPRTRPQMPAFGRRRESFTQLRDRHLLTVEEHGVAEHYDRNDLHAYFLTNWNRLFGAPRKSGALEVPSDDLRKEIMACQLLGLVEMRREEYAEERTARSF
jgi:hypothetical protein